jgi:peptidoglycan hydrolase-like protein with peptidoglycan-binding domain
MSYRSRVYRERNPGTNEEGKEKPFFSKQKAGKEPGTRAFFQAKLSVNNPGDHYEQEADHVADAVVNQNTGTSKVQKKKISSIQRLSTPIEDEKLGTNDARMEKDKEIQEKPVSPTGPDKEKEKKPVQKMDDPDKEKEKKPVQKMDDPEKEKEKKAVQKMDDPEKEKEKKKPGTVQKKNESAGTTASSQVSSKIENSSGRGESLPSKTLREMNSSFGADFSGVNIHKDGEAASLNKELHAQAFTHGRDIYFNEGKFDPSSQPGKLLLAHELTHVVQQGAAGEKIQRDLAIEPSNPLAEVQDFTDKQIRDAILFNNERYNESSIRLIQDIVGATVTGVMDEATIPLIALFQAQNGLTPDGKVGPNTFNQMTAELGAEGVSDDTCLNMFLVGVRSPMEIHAAALPNTANIFGHFDVEIRFSPHCDCSKFEYRQFISGNVTLNGININNQFSIPPGNVLPVTGNFIEDGNTNLNNNGRYGHRVPGDNRGPLNQYLDAAGNPDMLNGCTFHSFDEPGVTGAPANTGDTYVFDFRFFGDIRKNGTMVERKFWSVRETIVIP